MSTKEPNEAPLKAGQKLWMCYTNWHDKERPVRVGYYSVIEMKPRRYKKGKREGQFYAWDIICKGGRNEPYTIRMPKSYSFPYGFYESFEDAILSELQHVHSMTNASIFGGIAGSSNEAKVGTIKDAIYRFEHLIRLYEKAKKLRDNDEL